MRYTPDNVDIPDDLISALSTNALVVFVGAGVSARAYPNQKKGTYYPTFSQLVEQIAQKLGRSLTQEEKKLLRHGAADRILGDWDKGKFLAHQPTAQILSENESAQRIELHRALVRLFPPNSTPRIVTTNFDKLLLRAIEIEYPEVSDRQRWPIHYAPALPPASRFAGLCFLHGSVAAPDEMVLTDKDIGRAYMDEGWALRFAHGLFRSFNVLFVGYSLEDPPLRYLSLALEGTSTKRHWVVLPAPKSASQQQKLEFSWRRRGVTAIWYQAILKDYRAVERTIDAWGKDNCIGFIDAKNLLMGVGKTLPDDLTPYERDRARYFLKSDELLRDFARSEPDPGWFEVLVEDGQLKRLLASQEGLGEPDDELARCIVRWLIADSELWIAKLSPYRPTLHSSLFHQFCRAMDTDREEEVPIKTIRHCLALFRCSIERASTVFHPIVVILPLVRRLVSAGMVFDAVWLFSKSISIHTHIDRNVNLHYVFLQERGEDPAGVPQHTTKMELRFRAPHVDYAARQVLDNVLYPNIQKVGSELLRVFTSYLLEARHSVRRFSEFPDESFRTRAAIEKHRADEYREGPLHLFIDILRDGFQHLLPHDTRAAIAFRDYWLNSGDVVLERLAIHATRMLLGTGNNPSER